MNKKEKYRLAKIGALKLPPVVQVLQGRDHRGHKYYWFQPEGTAIADNSGEINGVKWSAQRVSRKSAAMAYAMCLKKVYQL